MRAKVEGLSAETGSPVAIAVPAWHHIAIVGVEDRRDKQSPHFSFECRVIEGQSKGGKFKEKMWLSDAALPRLNCFLSRAGYPKDLIEQEIVDDEVCVGLTLWAALHEEEYQGQKSIKIDGWKMRSDQDGPPSEAQEPAARDYTKENTESPEQDEDLKGL